MVISCGFTSYKSKSTLPEKLPSGVGQEIYLNNGCAECHGIEGKGNGALSEFLEPNQEILLHLKK